MNKLKKYLTLLIFLFIILKNNKVKYIQNQCNPKIDKIKIGIIYPNVRNGGIQKKTSLLLQELSKVQFLKLFF